MQDPHRLAAVPPLRIAHCSDIHLDGGSSSDRGQSPDPNDRYRAGFARALREMSDHRPDLIAIAGDLFDSNRAPTGTVEWAMHTLGQLPCPVVMIPGNHDCLEAGGIYRRYDFNAIDNVTLLLAQDGELASFPGLGVAAWGRGMSDHHPDYRPLAGCPERPAGAQWYLGLGHGIFVPRGEDTHRSSPVRMEDIDASPCDYLALGHHHAALDVGGEATAAAYCGSPTDDFGRGETYVVVDLESGREAAVKIHVLGESADSC